MATIQLVDNKANSNPDLKTVFYTAPAAGDGVVIDAFTASNVSNVNASYKAYIESTLPSGQPQIPFKIVVWGENDLGVGIANQFIPPGGTLSMESSAANSIYFTVTGRER